MKYLVLEDKKKTLLNSELIGTLIGTDKNKLLQCQGYHFWGKSQGARKEFSMKHCFSKKKKEAADRVCKAIQVNFCFQ